AEAEGLPAAHLVKHVALDLLAAVAPGVRRSGVTCAHKDRLDRYDVFFDCDDPILGRAAALLSAASVRDLCLGQDRLGLHGRCRDLLADLAARGGTRIVPEDVAASRSWSVPEALETLQALSRLGFLEPISAPFTFSSATGHLFRRAL